MAYQPSPEVLAAQRQLAMAANPGAFDPQLFPGAPNNPNHLAPPPPEMLGQDSEPFAAFHPGEGDEAPKTDEEVTTLTDEERAHFVMLAGIGRRTKTIDVFGHQVVIESLTVGDDQKIGLYCKEYKDAPPADSRSFQIAVCACGIRSVDNRPIYHALSDDEDVFMAKVNKLITMYPPVITEIYRAILDLDREFAELSEKLKKAKGSASKTS